MKFFHGTNKYGIEETKKQGFLLHSRKTKKYPKMSSCTYLATELKEAEEYGDIILEVEYDPFQNPKMNNYNKSSWQCRVYEPIFNYKVL